MIQGAARAKWLMPVGLIAYLYACWLGMMAAHELGHVLHSWFSGGAVERVVLPWFGFSRTDLARNPRPLFVALGGSIWGSLTPLLTYGLVATFRTRMTGWFQFFAGFCLIANGAYLAVGSLDGVGDAGDLMFHGAPRWTLIASGIPTAAAGIFLWHRLNLRRRSAPRVAECDG